MNTLTELQQLQERLSQQIIGQPHLVKRLLTALLANGHLLVEGAPGLAKTKAIRSLADALESNFQRIQFTPDLLPSDVTGTDVFRPETGNFDFIPGPIFHNLVLADEVNRAPAKVQAALLEAMSENQVSVGGTTRELPELFLVMATQNPIEQEGTYPLPEAQLDRFLLHVEVDYPSIEAERSILRLARKEELDRLSRMNDADAADADSGENDSQQRPLSQEVIFKTRNEILNLHLAKGVVEYIVQLTAATRNPKKYSETLAKWIEYGVSPRGSIALERCARVEAWLEGRDFVSPDDVRAVIHDIYRHRLILSFEAEANAVSANKVIDTLLSVVPVP